MWRPSRIVTRSSWTRTLSSFSLFPSINRKSNSPCHFITIIVNDRSERRERNRLVAGESQVLSCHENSPVFFVLIVLRPPDLPLNNGKYLSFPLILVSECFFVQLQCIYFPAIVWILGSPFQ